MYNDEIDEARRLEKDLLKRHEGQKLDDIFQGETCKSEQGSCYRIEESEKFKIKRIEKDKARSAILSNLKLLYGIGEAKERNLKEDGYETIEDLIGHPYHSQRAEEFIGKLHRSPMECISECLPGSHPNQLYSSSFREIEDFLFFDIETMGLKDVPVILIGMARISGGKINVTQYLATKFTEEKAMIHSFLSDLNDKTIFVSFNGRSFDMPYIRSRAYQYGIRRNLRHHHLDLLYFSRRTWGGKLPNCRLQTLEKHLFNMERHEDVPSSQVPSFYKTYLETDNIGPLVPIVEHNKIDVITLARILSRLQEDMD